MKKPRIMVAQSPSALEVTTTALQAYDLVVVTDTKAAQYQVMEDGIDLFLIGIHFDESQAIGLVNFIRSEKHHKTTPIILVRFLPTLMAESFRSIADALKKVGTISDYIEIEDEENPELVIRKVVEANFPVQAKESSL